MLKINTKRTAPFIAFLIMGVVFMTDKEFGFRGVLFTETHTRLIGLLLVVFALFFLFTHPKKTQDQGSDEKDD